MIKIGLYANCVYTLFKDFKYCLSIMLPKISLCIPTYNRFHTFLLDNIRLYLTNPYIDEIIISDENGEDIKNFPIYFPNEEKIKLFQNDRILGAFLNKSKAVSFAKNEWVCLMDSDNFAPQSYFEAWFEYIKINGLNSKVVYMPIKTIPQPNHGGFDYTEFKNIKLNKTNISYDTIDTLSCMLNTGNYIINKYNYLESNKYYTELHTMCGAQDVFFKAALLLLYNTTFVLVNNMMYAHIVHDGSYFTTTSHDFNRAYNMVKNIYSNIDKYNKLNQTDMILYEWQMTIKPKNKLLYNCSECTYLNDEWVPFPIGMGWSFINFTYPIEIAQIGQHNMLVLCAINKNTDTIRRPIIKNREIILQTLNRNNIFNIQLESSTYFKELPNYKFVISPEGNGIDCHRHYEALMAGCIPIVEDNLNIREKYKDLPILFTTDYSEITETYLLGKYNEMINTKYNFSKLLLDNYSIVDQENIKNNGNYWAMRLAGRNWY
jgi:hypothetical protein